MKILVTGGAGFIGSHTCDRLLSLGHEVIVLDALTPPVHRNGQSTYLGSEIDFYQGDTRNRDLVTNLLRRVDAVYHFAAYQDYLPDFSRFSEVNVVSTALLYEIIVAERLDLARVVVASSQSAMGEGLYRCPVDGEQTLGMRPESALAASQWDIPCPECGGPTGVAGHAGTGLRSPERLRHVQARTGDGRHQPRAPVRHSDRCAPAPGAPSPVPVPARPPGPPARRPAAGHPTAGGRGAARTAMPPPRRPSAAGWSAAAATGQPARRPRLAHTGPSSRTPTAGRPHTGPRPPRPATRSAPPAPPADDAPPAISCPLRTHPDHQPRKRSTIAAVKMSRNGIMTVLCEGNERTSLDLSYAHQNRELSTVT